MSQRMDAVVRNLKLFNAKERDHLMRFAYLGDAGPYDGSSTFLSPAFQAALAEHLQDMGIGSSAECVFAGMDYHLDWLFAALLLARTHPEWRGEPGSKPAPVSMAAIGDTDIPSLTGSQEDIDLLVVYRYGDGKLAMIFIEAKGIKPFEGEQLARKLVRIDRILDESGVLGGEEELVVRLLLASPEMPSEATSCREYAKKLLTPGTKGRDALLAALDNNRSGIGDRFHCLSLSGFPQSLYAVKRTRIAAGRAENETNPFTHWKLVERR